MPVSRGSRAFGLPRAADECVDLDGVVRPPYAELLATLERAAGTLPQIRRDAQQWFADRGVTFGVPTEGVAPIFPFDPVPRVLSSTEWRSLSRAPLPARHGARSLRFRLLRLATRDSPRRGARAAGVQQHRLPPRHRRHPPSPRHLVPRVGDRRRARQRHLPRARGQRPHPERHRLCAGVAARDGITGAGMVRARPGPADPRLHRPAPPHPAAHRSATVGRRHRGADPRLVQRRVLRAPAARRRDERHARRGAPAHRGRGRGVPAGCRGRGPARGRHLLARQQRVARSRWSSGATRCWEHLG